MRRALFLIPLLALIPLRAPAAPDEPSSVLLRALGDEMKRTVERLDMESLGLPYFVSYTAEDVVRVELRGAFGALKDPNEMRWRKIRVDVRVGSPLFDNTHYVGRRHWEFSPLTESLVAEDDYDALRYDLWSATDRAYKQAQDVLSKKRAYKQSKLIKEEYPDLSAEPVSSSTQALTRLALDRQLWEDRVRRLSAVFRRYPSIQTSEVSLLWTQKHGYFLDSEGRRVVKNNHDIEVYMEAGTQAPDGMRLSDRRRIIRQSSQDFPSFHQLQAEAEGLAKDIDALSRAKLWEGSYTGPVLLEGQAAGEFFNQLLARNVSFPRAVWVEDEDVKGDFHAGDFADKLGLRVVSPILSVVDDPLLERHGGVPLLGHYTVDDEGIPAQRVGLIEKGILKDVLMSRSPIKERAHSNGHGRASFEEHATAHIGNLIVSSDKTAAPAELKKELLRQAKAFGVRYGIVIRRIADEGRQEKGETLAEPVLVYKVYEDGREELVRNAAFHGLTLRALRDVELTGDSSQVYNYYQYGPYRYNRGEAQASIVHPSVLVAEMELKKSEHKPEKPPALNHPYFPKSGI